MLRDILGFGSWYKLKQLKLIEGVQVIACARDENLLPPRLTRHFALLRLETQNIVSNILQVHSSNWSQLAQSQTPQISAAITDIYEYCAEQLKPSPLKIQY